MLHFCCPFYLRQPTVGVVRQIRNGSPQKSRTHPKFVPPHLWIDTQDTKKPGEAADTLSPPEWHCLAARRHVRQLMSGRGGVIHSLISAQWAPSRVARVGRRGTGDGWVGGWWNWEARVVVFSTRGSCSAGQQVR